MGDKRSLAIKWIISIIIGLSTVFILQKYVLQQKSLLFFIIIGFLLVTFVFFVLNINIVKKNKKRDAYLFTKKYLSDYIRLVIAIAFAVILELIVKNGGSWSINNITIISEEFNALLDNNTFGVFITIILAVICDYLANFIGLLLIKNKEDAVKQTEDYSGLCKRYNRSNLLKFVNKEGKNDQLPIDVLSCKKINETEYNFVINEKSNNGKIEHYQLPEQIKENSKELLISANLFSEKFNNTNVRINSINIKDNNVDLTYSFTNYYDSIITNKTMDFPLSDGRTVREIFEPGPFINSLEDSKLSNHLGFNGFVELNDGNIIFVKRYKNILTAKNKWQQSVGASMKSKYCLDDNRKFTKKGLSDAIKGEIKDELLIELGEEIDYSKSIFAFYRDLVEGGKPQFLFYIKCNKYNKDTFEEHFKKIKKEKEKNKKNALLLDGTSFKFFSISQLKEAKYTDHSMFIDDKEYEMTPSSIASIILFLQGIA